MDPSVLLVVVLAGCPDTPTSSEQVHDCSTGQLYVQSAGGCLASSLKLRNENQAKRVVPHDLGLRLAFNMHHMPVSNKLPLASQAEHSPPLAWKIKGTWGYLARTASTTLLAYG